MPPIYDDYIDESGFGRLSTLGNNDPTILQGVESKCNNYENVFRKVMTLDNFESTVLEDVSINVEDIAYHQRVSQLGIRD